MRPRHRYEMARKSKGRLAWSIGASPSPGWSPSLPQAYAGGDGPPPLGTTLFRMNEGVSAASGVLAMRSGWSNDHLETTVIRRDHLNKLQLSDVTTGELRPFACACTGYRGACKSSDGHHERRERGFHGDGHPVGAPAWRQRRVLAGPLRRRGGGCLRRNYGAVEKTRTSTGLPPQAPQACASTIPPRPLGQARGIADE
jgi:hypothetical protein